MAERKNTTRSSTATGKSKPKSAAAKSRSKKAAELEAQRIRQEALERETRRRRTASIILFALGIIFTLMALIKGDSGWTVLYNIMHGLFGAGAYVVGPFMIYTAIILSLNRTSSTVLSSVLKNALCVLMVCAVAEIFSVGQINGENFGEVVKNLYEGGLAVKGGGFFAIVLGVPLLFLGKVGASIVIVIIALVCIFLMTNLTLPEVASWISSHAKQAGEAAGEYHERFKHEKAIADEHYRQKQEERRAEQEIERERKRALAEVEKEQRARAREEQLKNVMDKMSNESAEPVQPNDEPIQLLSSNQTEAPVRHEPVLGRKEKNQPAPETIAAEPSEPESGEEMLRKLRAYMEKKHPIMRDEEPSDPLEDKNAELVPIVDALSEFEKEHGRPARVSKIVNAPADKRTTSDVPVKEISDTDEAELALDIDDIVSEQKRSQIVDSTPVKPFGSIFDNQPAKPAEKTSAPKPATEKPQREYKVVEAFELPGVDLLNPVKQRVPSADIQNEIRATADKLVKIIKSFGVETTYTGAARGPSVTRYELQLAPGVKISKIQNLSDDIALHIGASGVRIAPVPEKVAVGVEVPNDIRETVFFRELIESDEYKKSFDKKLLSVLGKDISGSTVTCNVSKMPHLLIAGTTGSGKSVCVNSIIMSILMKSTPDDVRLIMIDPKQVEFMMYNGIPHLLIPVVTDPKKAAGALAWAVTEMENRYSLFSENNVRNIEGYNELAARFDNDLKPMPQIVIFIDELADLMMASPKDVEDSIVRLAQKARAAGMNLVIATQKPTVQVVTGLIKGNIPSRIALMVASQIDSRVILDSSGAEKLLGNGDMLYQPVGVPKPIRLQGCYVSDDEVERVVDHIKQAFSAEYDESIMAEIERQVEMSNGDDKTAGGFSDADSDDYDDKLEDAIDYVITAGSASTSALQRKLGLGFSRAGRIMDTMERLGVVGPTQGSKPRQVLMTKQEWNERKLRS